MTKTNLQVGGGYAYQWECAMLIALNYFFDPGRYSSLYDLVTSFLGLVGSMRLEGEDQARGLDLEDINLLTGSRRILIQVKTKQSESGRWTPSNPLLLKALYKFYDNRFFGEEPENTRFVFLSNCGFNRALARTAAAMRDGTLGRCAEAEKLIQQLDRYAAAKKGNHIDSDRCREMLARTALIEYLKVDAVKANLQAKLQAYGRGDWREAHALLFEYFARQSTQAGGGVVTAASITELLGLQRRVQIYLEGPFESFTPERRDALVAALAGILKVSSRAIQVYSVTQGSIVLDLGLPAHTVPHLRWLLHSNNAQLRLMRLEKVTIDPGWDTGETWILDEGQFRLASQRRAEQVLETITFYGQARVIAQSASVASATLPSAREVFIRRSPRHVVIGGQKIEELTELEFELLYYLFQHRGQVCSLDELIVHLFGPVTGVSDSRLYTLVKRLRFKVEPDPRCPRYIVTVRGQGYMFIEPEEW